MLTPRFVIAVLGVVLIFGPAAALGQQDRAENDPVVARVDGDAVHQSEVLELALTLPPQYQAQLLQLFPLLLERVIDLKLAGRAGRASGLAEDEEVKLRLAKAEEKVIRDVYIERQIQARVTPEGLRIRYQSFLAANPPKTEHRARHILLETEQEAIEVIAKLDGGADFVELAKTMSTGPSASQGGDLGYFTAEDMVPEFVAAAAALEPGEHSKAPTQSQFGWHVIKVEDRRVAAPPAFEDVEGQLRQSMSREVVNAMLQELRAAATIEILLPAGPAPEPEAKSE